MNKNSQLSMEEVLRNEIADLKEKLYTAELELETALNDNQSLELLNFNLEEQIRVLEGRD